MAPRDESDIDSQANTTAARTTAKKSSDTSARYLLLVHRYVVAPATLALVFLIGPLQSSDEFTHFYRADTLSNGSIEPVVIHSPTDGDAAGGPVDVALRRWVSLLKPPDDADIVPTSRRFLRETFDIRSDGVRTLVPHSNTAIYPPFLYVQSAATVWAARAAGLPVGLWFYAARLANAIAAIAIVAVAMQRMPALRPVILVVAALPITMFQSATVSADAILLPASIAFACLLAQLLSREGLGSRGTALLIGVTLLLGVGKVAYMPFALLPPLAARVADGRWSRRAVCVAAASLLIVLLWAGWAWAVHDKVFTIRPDVPVAPAAQLRWMLGHPLDTVGVFVRSLASTKPALVSTAVGSHLGNLNLRLPHPLIYVGVAMLAAAAFRTVLVPRPPRWFTTIVFAICIGIGATVVLLLYLQFNAVGAARVEGLQGRYFLPPLIALLVFSPVRCAPRARPWFDRLAAGFAVASVATTLFETATSYWAA